MSLVLFVSNITTCQNTSGNGSRKILLQCIKNMDNDICKKLLVNALSPYRIFNQKKIVLPKEIQCNSQDSDVELFLQLCDDLHDRKLTGHAARDMIQEVLRSYTYETATILRCVLLKNLKSRFSGDSVNEVFCGSKDPLVPVVPIYTCMLADKITEEQIKNSNGKIANIKYDGQRNNTFVYGVDEFIHYARSGKLNSHIEGLFDDDINKMFKACGNVPFVLDGEIIGKSFNSTIKAKGKKNVQAKEDLVFVVYDIIAMDEWNSRRSLQDCKIRMPNIERLELIDKLIDKSNVTKIVKSKYEIINNNLDDIYENALNLGYEGLVIKDPLAYYEWERSSSWLKYKPTRDFNGIIIDFYSGNADHQFENTLGGIVVEGYTEDGTYFKSKVGGGFTIKDRENIWNNRDKYLGKHVEIEADPNLTKSEDSDVHSIRWGVFVKFRPDRDLI